MISKITEIEKLLEDVEIATAELEDYINETTTSICKKAFTLGFSCAASKLKEEPTTSEWLEAKIFLGLD